MNKLNNNNNKRPLPYGIYVILKINYILLKLIKMKFYNYNGHHKMKLYLLQLVVIVVLMFGMLVELVKNKVLKMLKTVHQN